MRDFHEMLVVVILLIAIALFFGGFVWRLYRGDGRNE